MYQFFQSPVGAVQGPMLATPWQRVGKTVVFLGLTSMFTDVSSEMITAILPLYLTLGLGFSPLYFGLFEGLYQGVTAFLRIAAGVVTDRFRRHKEVAGAGYALSAVCKFGLFTASGAWGTMAWLFLDRGGKSIRTPARDALICLASHPTARAEAYGVHRALDAFGALLGPVAAFALLALVPGGFDLVFLVSFCFAILGLAILTLFVEPPDTIECDSFRRPTRAAGGLTLFRNADFRAVMIVGGLLSVMTISDAFVYLTLHQQSGLTSAMFPLLYVGTALAYCALAHPVGRLADRVGRRRVFVAGHVLLLPAYGLLLAPRPGAIEFAGCLLLLGAYYATTDGVLMAVTSSVVPRELLTTGLAVVTTGTAAARFTGSALYGALWHWYGVSVALLVFLTGLCVALCVGAVLLGAATKDNR
jgi:MFS family permease